MHSLNVPLGERLIKPLVRLAEQERRHPRQQAAYLIEQALRQAGMIPAEQRPARTETMPEVRCEQR